jgi:hypothetical protein
MSLDIVKRSLVVSKEVIDRALDEEASLAKRAGRTSRRHEWLV